MKILSKIIFLFQFNFKQIGWILSYLVFSGLGLRKSIFLDSFYQYFSYLYFFDGRCLKFNNNYSISRIDKVSPNELKLRLGSSSDLDVFQQTFFWKEYEYAIRIFKDKLGCMNNLNILDCGANIGLVSVLFKNKFHNSKILTVEPNQRNFELLTFNLKGFQGIINLNAGIWNETTKLGVGKAFRDGKDWSFRLEKNGEKKIQAFSISYLIAKYKFTILDILKIDIEGAEEIVFDENSDLKFLDVTKCIIIEIHDEVSSRKNINAILRLYNFSIHTVGELTVGINKNYNKSNVQK